jgi:ABC-2 type transport system permease protein
MLTTQFAADMIYRASFLSGLTAVIAYTFVNLLTVILLVNALNNIVGWNTYELLILLGSFRIIVSLIFFLCRRALKNLADTISRGELDFYLTKPVDSQFYVSLQTGGLQNLISSLIGVALVLIGLFYLKHIPSLSQILLFLVFLLVSLSIYYSLMLAAATLNFWFDRLDNIVDLVNRFNYVSRFPADAYKKGGSIIFSLLLPFALATTVPAGILIQKNNPLYIFLLIVIAIVFLILSRLFWLYALRRYQSASS